MKNKLKELRKQEKYTLKYVSSELGISLSALSMYEGNACEPSIDVLCRLADFYGVSIDYILCRETPTPGVVITQDRTLKAILDIYETLTPVQRGQLRAMAEILKSTETAKKH